MRGVDGNPGRFRREIMIAAAAVWGMSFALSSVLSFRRPAPPGQLPGFMTNGNMDAAGPFRAALLAIVAPFVLALLGRWLARFFDPEARTWAFVAAVAGMLGSAWLWRTESGPLPVLLFPVVPLMIALLLRRFDAGFTRRDVILIPVGLTIYFALLDLNATWGLGRNAAAATLIVLLLRLTVAKLALRRNLDPSSAFVLAPLAIIFQSWLLRDAVRFDGRYPLAFAIATPMVLALLIPQTRQHFLRRVIAYGTLPAAVLFYFASLTMTGAGPKGPQIDFFEDGHSLMPASEMLRGELPYRDVVPGHGLGEDGLLDLVLMKTKGVTAGDVFEARLHFSSLNAVGIYAAGFAATGSPEIGYVAAMLSTTMIPWGPTFTRSVFAFFALAFAIAAIRRRRRRYFVGAGVLAALQCLHSVDFGFYAVVAVLVAALLSAPRWKGRAGALLRVAAGGAVVLIPACIVFISLGIFDDFLRVTFVEIPALSEVYTLGFPDLTPHVPQPWSFPEVLSTAIRSESLPWVLWPVVLIVTAAVAAHRLTRRSAPLVVVGSYVAIAVLSYAERRHAYFAQAIPLFLVIGIFLLWRARKTVAPVAATVLMTLTVVAANITPHLIVATIVRMNHAVPNPEWVDMWETPRARHALFRHDDARRFRLFKRFMESTLAPNETFFDFSNVPLVYFLLDRPAPIRQYEVPFFQEPRAQREVIARLQGDLSVRAALVSFPLRNHEAIDDIPNRVRAPLVWNYLQENFRPAYKEDGVEVWLRK